MTNQPTFWEWVASRKARDNPRGDFTHDTRDILAAGKDPEQVMIRACCEVKQEKDRLLKEYSKRSQ